MRFKGERNIIGIVFFFYSWLSEVLAKTLSHPALLMDFTGFLARCWPRTCGGTSTSHFVGLVDDISPVSAPS